MSLWIVTLAISISRTVIRFVFRQTENIKLGIGEEIMRMYLLDKKQRVRRWLKDNDFIEAEMTGRN